MSECVSGDHKTEGPPKKRPKLSLKSRRKETTKSTMPSQQKITPMLKKSASKENLDGKSENEGKILKTEDNHDQIKEFVPPLTGLYNLGNTCYLNSVLQALRYCPQFSPSIVNLGSDIDKYCTGKPEDKSQDNNDKSETIPKDFPAHFHLVKRTKELLDSMVNYEDAYIVKPEVDKDVAVRPQDLLETLRDLNPMFQGYMQHDAQELLRCLLSHVQDASQRLLKIKALEDGKRSKQHQLPLNGYNGNRLETVNEDGSLCGPNTTEQNGYHNGTESASSCGTSVNGEGKENALNGKSSKKSKKQKKKSKAKSTKDNDANGDTISYSSSASSPTNTIKSIKKKKRLGLGRIRQAFFGKSKKKKVPTATLR